jgi:N-acetylmuramoyl-L-alanine amidase
MFSSPYSPDSPLAHAFLPSPNFGARLSRAEGDAQPLICFVILHYTGMRDGASALTRLSDPAAEVSAHYVIDEGGFCTQMVLEQHRAWHAGRAKWHEETDLNSRSIGVELVNGGHDFRVENGQLPPYPEAQIATLIALLHDICSRYTISPHNILAHSDIAPLRKQDVGEHFPWETLFEAGLGHWVAPAPLQDGRFFMQGERGAPIEALQTMFALYGYDLPVSGVFDAQTAAVVTAFQRHFRPKKVDGIADTSTLATLHHLIKACPNDVSTST